MSIGTKSILLLFFFGVIWLGISKYNSTIESNGKLKSEAEIYTDALDYKEWSAAITDEVVKEFVDDKVTQIETTEKTRKEAIDEYFKDDAITGVPKSSPVPVTDTSSDVRVGKLANSLLNYYCTARPKDPRCNPVSPVN